MPKERVSLTLDSGVLDRIDRKLAERGIDNRSQGIEQLLQEHLKQEAVTTAVVLAGGDDPKCTININGRPVINHILGRLAEAGVERVFVATGDADLEGVVDDHGLDLSFIVEDEPLGTAGCLRRVADAVHDTFLVVNGDVLCRVDLDDMAAAHRETDGLATIALTTVRDSSDYGVIELKRHKVVGFHEKPDESLSHLVNAGVYLLEPELIDRLPGEDEQARVDIEPLFETLAEERLLNGYVHDGEWQEVG